MLGLDNPIHILFLLVIVLLVFGAKRLPEMGKGLGDGMRTFRDSLSGATSSLQMSAEEPAAPETPMAERAPAQPTV